MNPTVPSINRMPKPPIAITGPKGPRLSVSSETMAGGMSMKYLSDLDVHKGAHDDDVEHEENAYDQHRRDEPGVFHRLVVVVGLDHLDAENCEQGKTRKELAGPLRFGGNRLDAAEKAKACADHLCKPRQDLGKVAAGLLLDGHRHREKAQVLHVKPFGHVLECLADIAAIGGLVCNHAELCGQGVGHLGGDDADGRGERMADAQAS